MLVFRTAPVLDDIPAPIFEALDTVFATPYDNEVPLAPMLFDADDDSESSAVALSRRAATSAPDSVAITQAVAEHPDGSFDSHLGPPLALIERYSLSPSMPCGRFGSAMRPIRLGHAAKSARK